MWWQYVVAIVASLFIALIAVRFDHWLSGRNEYRKAISSMNDDIDANIAICALISGLIDKDLKAPEGKLLDTPYRGFSESTWNTWKGVILVRNYELASKIEAAYFCIPIMNKFLYRIEELKWGPVAVVVNVREQYRENLKAAKRYVSKILLPHLRDAKECLERESQGRLRR